MLSPYDIHNKEFKRSFRGYDVDEVNDFLDQIIKDFELLTREKLELEAENEQLQAELERVMENDSMFATGPQAAPEHSAPHGHYQESPQLQPQMPPQMPQQMQQTMQQQTMQQSTAALASMEQSIHKSIRVAQEVAEEVRLNAKKEAELIVQEAEKNADRIINEALQKARAIHSELLDLKQKATIYRARFRNLVQSHLDILENSDWESLEEIEGDLEEHGKQLEHHAEPIDTTNPDLMMDHLHHTLPMDEPSFGVSEDTDFGFNINTMEEVAPTFLDESHEEERPRELRRTSRKLKKKAMF